MKSLLFRQHLTRILSAVGPVLVAACTRVDHQPLMELEQTMTSEFPDSSFISGLQTNGAQKFFAWGRLGQNAAVLEGPPWSQLRTFPSSLVLGAGLNSSGHLEAMVRRETPPSVEFVTISTDPKAQQPPFRIDLPARAIQSVIANNAWFIVGTTNDSALVVFRWTLGDGLEQLSLSRPFESIDGRPPNLRLSVDSASLLLTRVESPFTVQRINFAGAAIGEVNPLLDDRVQVALAKTPAAIWASLPALPVDSGVIQTIADLASERRVLVVSSWSGKVLSVRTLDTALGFVTSDVPGRLLCGVRTLNRRELVCYRW